MEVPTSGVQLAVPTSSGRLSAAASPASSPLPAGRPGEQYRRIGQDIPSASRNIVQPSPQAVSRDQYLQRSRPSSADMPPASVWPAPGTVYRSQVTSPDNASVASQDSSSYRPVLSSQHFGGSNSSGSSGRPVSQLLSIASR